MAVKNLRDMMKDADKTLSDGTLPFVFLDTGAIIDICKSARDEEMKQRGKKSGPLNETYADHFLMNFAGKYQTLMSPLTHAEITRHYSARLNGNTKEIKEAVYPLVNKFLADYRRLSPFVADHVHDDTDKYVVYWVTKNACTENEKKYLEGFSDVDRDILGNAVLFSKFFYKDERRAHPVAVFSSDEHIFKGVEMLNELGYKNLVTISSRSRNGK